jgi:hypothetical protein
LKNNYIIENNSIKIFLRRRKKNDYIETIIDIDDFDKLNNYNGTFYAAYDKKLLGYYAIISIYLGTIDGKPKYKTHRVSRIIMTCNDSNIDIDHINGNSLDNRKENLRAVSASKNLRNRKRINSNNISGCRNVSFYNNKYIVQLQVNGKNKTLGRFDTFDEAKLLAVEMRKKYYGDNQ